MFRNIFAWINRYERHLSVAAMIGGFIVDSIYFDRVDIWQTQTVFIAYVAICFISIPLLHYIETQGARTGWRPRWRGLLPIATQFALGGLWSGFVIFYGRSAVIGASWPFLLFIFAILIGNEVFKKYHERLVFTSVLFFFALYSYAIFLVPIYTNQIGTLTFLESGVAAIVVFGLFTALLRMVGKERFLADIFNIRLGSLAVFLTINLFYFTNILPPLPLAAKAVGIYHSVERVPGDYVADTEQESWLARYLGLAPTEHVLEGDSLYAYTSVFAPTALTTTIVHRWQWYDPERSEWVTRAAITYPIQGGRDGGYRGYSAAIMRSAGRWRVSVETADGRVIARLPFTVIFVNQKPPLETIILP
ncbi:MAG: DUF2914 domain-containing protein [bacterium]|nr:DUF2914 domain-containing protein [bacterium]